MTTVPPKSKFQDQAGEAAGYAKPLPTLNDDNRPFWEGTRNNRLMLQQCGACSHVRYPTAQICPRCLSDAAQWVQMSGRGSIFSYIVFHQVYDRSFKNDVPYNVALIQLDEGPRLFSNIVVEAGDRPKVGDRVTVCFDPVTPEITLPRFRLAR
jgi:uncharacterized protein